MNVAPLYRALRASLDSLDTTWQLVLVDDGSTDGTWTAIVDLYRQDARVSGVRLSRNFGHQYALLAGLTHASGAAVVSMDGDLQHPPELIPELVTRWRRGSLIVHTRRLDTRRQSLFKRVSSRLFYRVYSVLSGARLDAGHSDFRLIDRQVLDELLRFGEQGMFLRGLVQWVGYPASCVAFECGERHAGSTKYSLRRMLKFATTGVTSFSLAPLRAAVMLGLLTSTASFAAIVYAVGSYFAGFPTVPGWVSAVSIMAFLFGMLFIQLGIIGEYVGKVLIEAKRRPRYLVHERVGVPAPAADLADVGSAAPLTAGLAGHRIPAGAGTAPYQDAGRI